MCPCRSLLAACVCHLIKYMVVTTQALVSPRLCCNNSDSCIHPKHQYYGQSISCCKRLFLLPCHRHAAGILTNTDRHICSGIVTNCSWYHASNWCHTPHCNMHQVPVPLAKSAGVAPGYLVAWASVLGTVSCHRSSATVSEARRTDALLQ